MYSKKAASAIRQSFWTKLGRYLSPIVSASGEKINWINYKAGVKKVQVKMEVTNAAYIGFEITSASPDEREKIFGHFCSLRNMLHEAVGEAWIWEEHSITTEG